MNATQLKTVIAAVITALAAALAHKYPFLGSVFDPATWDLLVSAIASAIAIWLIARFTTIQNLSDTVGSNGALVITKPSIANSLPDNKNVIGTDEVKVLAKADNTPVTNNQAP